MNREIVYFLVGFIIPFLYYRTLLFAYSKIFDKPALREKTGLKFHHLHYGMILMGVATFLLIFVGKSTLVIVLLGLSMGFMYDEFIPILIMKSKRKDEMIAYKRSFVPTLILFLVIILILILIEIF